MGVPLLSILVPAFNYADGVKRIIRPLIEETTGDFEVLVFDDSTTNGVRDCCIQLAKRLPQLRYRRKGIGKGAVANWNALIKEARGKYLLLLHHDDFQLERRFVSIVREDIVSTEYPDVLLLQCRTFDVKSMSLRAALPVCLSLLVSRHLPWYLFRRNLIGPPSAIVIRRELYQQYDEQLKWLVDVDLYFRVFRERPIVHTSRAVMISSTGLPTAITSEMAHQHAEIDRRERRYLQSKYVSSRVVTLGLKSRVFRVIESVFWTAIKGINFGSGAVISRKIHKRVAARYLEV